MVVVDSMKERKRIVWCIPTITFTPYERRWVIKDLIKIQWNGSSGKKSIFLPWYPQSPNQPQTIIIGEMPSYKLGPLPGAIDRHFW